MTSPEIVKYIANVLSVIRADNSSNSLEEKAFEIVISEIGAKKKEIKDAERMVSDKDFIVAPVGRYSEIIRNFEDMVYVAKADGVLSDTENQKILSFASKIDITEEQIELIISDTNSRLLSKSVVIKCVNCSAEIPSNSKFCPECGLAIGESKNISDKQFEFKYQNTGCAIEFSETTSANFEIALKIAKSTPIFQEIEKNRKKWYLASWPKGNVKQEEIAVDSRRQLANVARAQKQLVADHFRLRGVLAQRRDEELTPMHR